MRNRIDRFIGLPIIIIIIISRRIRIIRIIQALRTPKIDLDKISLVSIFRSEYSF